MRVLIFGDSITQGYWDTDGGWVERIRKHYDTLQASDLDGRDEPTIFNLGISANNSKNVLDRIQPETIARTRHGNLPVIIIQIGINDSAIDNPSTNKENRTPVKQYQQNLGIIIEKANIISSKVIFVGLSACDEKRTMPVFWDNVNYTNSAIKKYENVLKAVADEKSVTFIPIFDNFKTELNKGRNLLADGLHPNNEGHSFIAKIVLDKLNIILR